MSSFSICVFAASVVLVFVGSLQPAVAVPLGGIGVHVRHADTGTTVDIIIHTGSAKKLQESSRRAHGAAGPLAHNHYFTREKIVKDYYNGHIPPARVTGPVIYTYRWFDNANGGRR